MGNAILCRNTPCTQPRPVYKTVLSQIFQIALEKPRNEPVVNRSENIENEPKVRESPEQVDVFKLEAHVKSHIKALIDYLEGGHNKLIDTGNYLHKVVTGSVNPDIHMLGLLVVIELLNASPKFTHDKTFLAKLHQRGNNEEFIKGDGSTKSESKMQKRGSKELENSSFLEYGQSLRGNVVLFEDNAIEIINFLLDGKRNPFRKSCYKYVLKALDIYAKNNVGSMTTDKIEVIIEEALLMIESYRNLTDKESLEVQIEFMEFLITLTKTNNILLKLKQKFINHSCNTLKFLYENNNNQDINELTEKIQNLSFEVIACVTQSIYDLNEFGILTTPLFAFFDSTAWQNDQLKTDIFMSLMDSMSRTSFEQVEIFIIDKIVEYLDFEKYNSNSLVNPYKHNEDIEVKIRVFSLLETMFERTKKTFLSFLVIDNITMSFFNNLSYQHKSKDHGQQLKDSIYSCQKKFIEKINSSSKNLSQMLNSITTQIFINSFKDNREDRYIYDALDFFAFTVNEISYFPNHHPVPKDSMLVLLKVRNIPEIFSDAFNSIEKLLNIQYYPEESNNFMTDARKEELLTCPPDVAYTLFSYNLTMFRSLHEQKESGGPDIKDSKTLLKFVLHCIKINESLILRRDVVTIILGIAFLKKIMDLIGKEGLKNQQKGLLLYLVLSFLKKLDQEWNINQITPHIEAFAKILPEKVIGKINQDISNQESQKLLSFFGEIEYKGNYRKEFDTCLEIIITHIKNQFTSSNFENLNEDFDDLGSLYQGNLFISIDDGEKVEQSMDHNNRSHLTDMSKAIPSSNMNAKRNNAKQGSMISFNHINHNSMMRNSLPVKADENNQENNNSDSGSFIDRSFENALKEAKKNKTKTNNLTKILNNQI